MDILGIQELGMNRIFLYLGQTVSSRIATMAATYSESLPGIELRGDLVAVLRSDKAERTESNQTTFGRIRGTFPTFQFPVQISTGCPYDPGVSEPTNRTRAWEGKSGWLNVAMNGQKRLSLEEAELLVLMGADSVLQTRNSLKRTGLVQCHVNWTEHCSADTSYKNLGILIECRLPLPACRGNNAVSRPLCRTKLSCFPYLDQKRETWLNYDH
ncbi:hypothetical protein EAI_10198 [Harpegnathos saltator]|uniref:Uncharacterized protein n=1 Tax=Harpegnathos saltator TaxID=610380 RepID=E2BYP8_HARSA|nr:hypothetical protein EAI_10198 [Harpegnathos saltator]